MRRPELLPTGAPAGGPPVRRRASVETADVFVLKPIHKGFAGPVGRDDAAVRDVVAVDLHPSDRPRRDRGPVGVLLLHLDIAQGAAAAVRRRYAVVHHLDGTARGGRLRWVVQDRRARFVADADLLAKDQVLDVFIRSCEVGVDGELWSGATDERRCQDHPQSGGRILSAAANPKLDFQVITHDVVIGGTGDCGSQQRDGRSSS